MTSGSKRRFDIVVVGASYAGLAMARALSVRLAGRFTIGVLDRAPLGPTGVKDDPRASALSAGSVNLLRNLGVWNTIEPDAQPVQKIDITDPIGDSPLRQILLSYENTLDDAAPASWIVENAMLKSALVDTIQSDPNITILPPSGFIGLDSGSAATSLETSNGTITASLIIAADGANSRVREAAGIKTTGWPYDQTGIVTTVRHDRPHNATATQHFLPAGPFAILPLKGNADAEHRSSIVWTEDAAVARNVMASDDAKFSATLYDRFGTRLGKCESVGPRASWPLNLRLARNLTAGRVALIGDAARTVHPIAGQGLNLAMRDIAALADVVADATALGIDPGNAEPLGRYEQWRKFDASTSALTFDAINRLFSNNNAALRTARDIGLGLVARSPTLKSFFVREAAGLTGDVPSMLKTQDETSHTELAEAET